MVRGIGLLASLAATACTRPRADTGADAGPVPPPVPLVPPPPPASRSLDLISILDDCEIQHRGLSIDLGTKSVGARRGFSLVADRALDVTDRGGASFERVHAKKLDLEFWVDEPQVEGTRVSVRVFGTAARSVGAYIDGKRMGAAQIHLGEITVVTFPPAGFTIPRGRHTLALRFSQGKAAPPDPQVEIDWIRIGPDDAATGTYAAPTLRDVVQDFELNGSPKRSIVLRAMSSLRCPLLPARGAELRVGLGYWGTGRGNVEVRVVQDGEPPVTMQQRQITGGPGATWIPLTLDLSAYAGQLVGLELRVLDATGEGRVAFGEPVVTLPDRPVTRIPQAKAVVVVVASGIDRRRIPPWGAIGKLSALGGLARRATAFTQYRVPTTVPGAVMASLLTGLPPRAHTVESPMARLPGQLPTLSRIIKESSGRTALFTGVPTSFAPFGFDVGWDRFETFSPVLDQPASTPIQEAARWIGQELAVADSARLFVVIHIRGGHPPWDLSREDVARLPPEEYGGILDPRRGGVVLEKLRSSRYGAHKLPDEEWVRLHALQDAALLKQDVALGELIEVLEHGRIWDETLFVFCGDVGAGAAPVLPYEPAGRLTEDRLLVPLLVKFPGAQPLAKESATPVGTPDLTSTILAAFRLEPPAGVGDYDLMQAVAGQEPPVGRNQVATLGSHYAGRIGTWLLSGEIGRIPTLCRLDVDPACVNDAWDENPIAAQAAWRLTYRALAAVANREGPPIEGSAAELDPATSAALTVWGDLP